MAWADGELDATEISAVRDAASAASEDPSVQLLLQRWLDPEHPPSAFELALLLDGIEEAVSRSATDLDERLDLAALGLAIADASSGVSSVERDALMQVQEALGR